MRTQVRRQAKVVHITTVHPIGDTRILLKECRTLVDAGYEVILVVPHDKDEVREGVRIRAVPRPNSRIDRMFRTVWRAYRTAVVENADIYHFHDPELMGVAILLHLRGRRVIADVHEDVRGDITTKPYIHPLFRKLVAKAVGMLQSFSVGFYDAVIAATPAISRTFPKGKTTIVQNFPLLHELLVSDEASYHSRPPYVTYLGAISENRGIIQMVTAMSKLATPEARLQLGGNFRPASLSKTVRELDGWSRVDYLGYQTREQTSRLFARVRVGLVLFHPEPNHIEAQPNKLFEYMSAGLPVVASNFPLWCHLVEETGSGLTVDPMSPRAIADAIHYLLTHPDEADAMGRRGRQAIETHLNWEAEAPKLLALYEHLCSTTS